MSSNGEDELPDLFEFLASKTGRLDLNTTSTPCLKSQATTSFTFEFPSVATPAHDHSAQPCIRDAPTKIVQPSETDRVLPRRSPRLSPTLARTAAPLTPIQSSTNKPLHKDVAESPLRSEERHRTLAAELFPPSPPVENLMKTGETESAKENSRERSRSPSIISDSEVESSSPCQNRVESSNATTESSDKAESDQEPQINVKKQNFQLDETPTRRTAATFELDSDSDSSEGEVFAPIRLPSRSIFTPRSVKPARPSPNSRRHRRITISQFGSDDEHELILAETAARSGQEGLITADDDDENLASSAADESIDINSGVLIYEPTPQSRRPKKLSHASVDHNSDDTPRRAPHTKPSNSKLANVLDLTGSSESDQEEAEIVSNGAELPKFHSTPTAKRIAPSLPKSLNTTPSKFKPNLLTASEREILPLNLIRQLDKLVFRKRWEGITCLDLHEGTAAGLPDGIAVNWSNKLRNTAGRASWKVIRSADGTKVDHCTIDLATKVTDTESKLNHTLAHELCHIAAWVLSKEIKPPHGEAFKIWAKRIMKVRPDIKITTTHSYEISFKFRWQCQKESCAKIFQRHSRSINTSTQGCSCGGYLVEIDKDGAPRIARTPVRSAWQDFLTREGAKIRTESPGIGMGQVTKIVAERYKELKSRNSDANQNLVESMKSLKV